MASPVTRLTQITRFFLEVNKLGLKESNGLATTSLLLFPRTILMELRREKKKCIGLKLEKEVNKQAALETMLPISVVLNRIENLILKHGVCSFYLFLKTQIHAFLVDLLGVLV